MCVVSTPKIQSTTAADTSKPLQVLRNPLLDGIDQSISSLRAGRNSLRVDPGSTKPLVGIQIPTTPTAGADASSITPTPAIPTGAQLLGALYGRGR